MLIDCPFCDSKVDGKVLSEVSKVDDDLGVPISVSFLKCPSCGNPLIAFQEFEHVGPKPDDWEFTKSLRLWPKPDESFNPAIPVIVRESLEEADKCFKAKAYLASAVMCGRAIEGICVNHGVKSKSFYLGLKELHETGFIDNRLYQWGDALRKHRNIGAHASMVKIDKEDAEDLKDFAKAICDYIYVLTDKYNNFLSRTRVQN